LATPDVPVASKPLDEDLKDFENALSGGTPEPEPFDFDAALASATGVSTDSELVLSEEEIVPVDTAPPIDTTLKSGGGREKAGEKSAKPEGSGEFDIDDFGAPPPGPSGPPPLWKPGTPRPQELTVRPLSSEEDTPDLPAKKKKPDDDVDDMLANLFGDGH
jgi:hypothetical protein